MDGEGLLKIKPANLSLDSRTEEELDAAFGSIRLTDEACAGAGAGAGAAPPLSAIMRAYHIHKHVYCSKVRCGEGVGMGKVWVQVL